MVAERLSSADGSVAARKSLKWYDRIESLAESAVCVMQRSSRWQEEKDGRDSSIGRRRRYKPCNPWKRSLEECAPCARTSLAGKECGSTTDNHKRTEHMMLAVFADLLSDAELNFSASTPFFLKAKFVTPNHTEEKQKGANKQTKNGCNARLSFRASYSTYCLSRSYQTSKRKGYAQ